MNSVGSLLIAFSISMIGTTILTSSNDVHAGLYRRQSAGACSYNEFGSTLYAAHDVTVQNAGPTSTFMILSCPYLDDSSIPKSSLTAVYVDVSNGGSASDVPSAMACVANWNLTAEQCSPWVNGANSGWNNPSPNISAWSNSTYSSWYPAVVVRLMGGDTLAGYLAVQ